MSDNPGMDSMIRRTRVELQDCNLTTPDGQAESCDTVEDSDLEVAINEQFLFLGKGQTDPTTSQPYTLTSMPPEWRPLLAMNAAIQVLWWLANEASREVDVHLVEGITLPAAQRYQQLVSQIGLLQTKAAHLGAMLNVGLDRIEMFTLRRVSRTTNRLVPVYVEQEYDDLTFPPVRVYPPIDTGMVG